MVTGSARRAPLHWMSRLGFIAAVVAVLLALYGSMYAEKHLAGSPLREARGSAGLPAQPVTKVEKFVVKGETSVFGERFDTKMLALTERSKPARYAVQVVAYFFPFALGIGAALLGGWAMKAVEQSNGQRVGSTLAVFSIMIGGLAAVIAGCMIFSYYVWAWMPSLYTA